jgi:hypothetical protein
MRFTLLKVASAVLLACVAAGAAFNTSGKAMKIGVPGRANANASIASSGSFVGVTWAGRTKDGLTDVYAAASHDGGRSFGGAGAGEPGAWRYQCLRRTAAADSLERPQFDDSCNRDGVDSEL